MVRKPLKKRRYAMALVLSILLFSFGFLLGYWTVDAKLDHLVDQSMDLKLESFDFDVQTILLDKFPCDFFAADSLESDLSLMEDDLRRAEGSMDPSNEDLIYMKSYYSLLELKHWSFLNTFDEKCGYDFVTVFYFYNNDETECSDCVYQGYILQKLREQYSNVKVYSFDATVTVPSVQLIKDNYNITGYPSMVIDDEVYSGYVEFDALKNILEENGAM